MDPKPFKLPLLQLSLLTVATLHFFPLTLVHAAQYKPKWAQSENGVWIGPDYWATPLYDWSISNGTVKVPAAANRTLSVLPCSLRERGTNATFSIEIAFSGQAFSNPDFTKLSRYSAGFSIARIGYVNDYRSAAVAEKSHDYAAIRADGRLQFNGVLSEERLTLHSRFVKLTLSVLKLSNRATVTLTATQDNQVVRLTVIVPIHRVVGDIALRVHGPIKLGPHRTNANVLYKNFSIVGSMLQCVSSRSFGPILWSQYMISDETLRIQVQLAPVSKPTSVSLFFKSPGSWTLRKRTKSHYLSRTALFEIPGWDVTRNREFMVQVTYTGKLHKWNGLIRAMPTTSQFKLAVFSCDEGYLFPMTGVVAQVKQQNPDMIAFVGDQIYEESAGFDVGENISPARFATTANSMLDFLHKWYRFGWTWRSVLKNTPCILMPDDHDVYQGNLFGAGGSRLPDRTELTWSLGGYLMPANWVNAVERVHVGHLPPPAVDLTLPIGIKPYFTSVRYAGIDIAILEDRKFKTGPMMLNAGARTTGVGADLLGSAQEQFLTKWSQNWRNVSMKIAISATIFSKATTHVGPFLTRSKYFYDSGAWPVNARNRVVKLLADGNVLSIHGDQHLGVLLRQGIDTFNDGGYSFMVPGVANGFPRAWWPGVKERPIVDDVFTGHFVDDAGHPLNVLAVGNPDYNSQNLTWWTASPNEVAYRKGSGYGLVRLDQAKKTAKINLYRVGRQEQQFPGFPQTIRIGGGDRR